jgi:hypothetical protein
MNLLFKKRSEKHRSAELMIDIDKNELKSRISHLRHKIEELGEHL